jgi:hypothetical protein
MTRKGPQVRVLHGPREIPGQKVLARGFLLYGANVSNPCKQRQRTLIVKFRFMLSTVAPAPG